MKKEIVDMVYKEIQERIKEGKLIITGPVKLEDGYDMYNAIICMKEEKS